MEVPEIGSTGSMSRPTTLPFGPANFVDTCNQPPGEQPISKIVSFSFSKLYFLLSSISLYEDLLRYPCSFANFLYSSLLAISIFICQYSFDLFHRDFLDFGVLGTCIAPVINVLSEFSLIDLVKTAIITPNY